MPGKDADGFNRTIAITASIDNGNVRLTDHDGYVIAEAVLEEPMNKHDTACLQGELIDFEATRARCGQEMRGDDIYQWFADRGLEYGIDFRVLEQVRYGEGECTAILKQSLLRHERLHTLLIDGAIQAVGVVMARDTPEELYRVVGVSRLEMYVEQLERKTTYAVYGCLTGRELGALVADVCVCRPSDGRVLVRMTGVRFESAPEYNFKAGSLASSHQTLLQSITTPTSNGLSVSQAIDKATDKPYFKEDIAYLTSYIKDSDVNIPCAARERLTKEIGVIEGNDVIEDLHVSTLLRRALSDKVTADIACSLQKKKVVTACVVDDYLDNVTEAIASRFRCELTDGRLKLMSTQSSAEKHPQHATTATQEVLRDVIDVNGENGVAESFLRGSQDHVIYAGSASASYLVPQSTGPLVNCNGGKLYFTAILAANEFSRRFCLQTNDLPRDWLQDLKTNGFTDIDNASAVNNVLGAGLVVASRNRSTLHADARKWACLTCNDATHQSFSRAVQMNGKDTCYRISTPASLESCPQYDRLLYVADVDVPTSQALDQLTQVVDLAAVNTDTVVLIVKPDVASTTQCLTVAALKDLTIGFARSRDVYCVTCASGLPMSHVIEAMGNLSSQERYLDIEEHGQLSVPRNVLLATRRENNGKCWRLVRGDSLVEDVEAEGERGDDVFACSSVTRISDDLALLCGDNKVALSDVVRSEIRCEDIGVEHMNCSIAPHTLLTSVLSHVELWSALRPLRRGDAVVMVDSDPMRRAAAVQIAEHWGLEMLASALDDVTGVAGAGAGAGAGEYATSDPWMARQDVACNQAAGIAFHNDLGDEVMRATNGRGVACIVVDARKVGGATVDARLLGYCGRIVALGDGAVDVEGTCNGEFVRVQAETMPRHMWKACLEDLVRMYEQGALDTVHDDQIQVIRIKNLPEQ